MKQLDKCSFCGWFYVKAPAYKPLADACPSCWEIIMAKVTQAKDDRPTCAGFVNKEAARH